MASVPDWIDEAARLALREARLYVTTIGSFTARPARFAAEWAEGRREAMNPLGVLATSATILGAGSPLLALLLNNPANDPLWRQAANAIGPYLYYAVVAALCHLVLRLRGSRQPLRGSLAIALYTGGGPATLLWFGFLLTALTVRLGASHAGPGFTSGLTGGWYVGVSAVFYVQFLIYLFVFSRGLTGLHRLPWRWTVLGLVLATIAVGFLSGGLRAQGQALINFGAFHLELWLRRGPGGLRLLHDFRVA